MECLTITILLRGVRKGTFVKETLEKELKKLQEQIRQKRLGKGRSTKREQQQQRPWGGRMPGDLRAIKEATVPATE